MPEISFRPIRDDDRELLFRLYASTREEELAVTPWSEEQKSAFLRQQFEAQHLFYTGQFPDAELSVVLLDGEPAGRLYVDRREEEIRLIDIALLPEHRGRGIGSEMLRNLLEEGRERSLPVRIHVERFNPALRLYERLGFEHVEDQGPYYLMEWRPGAT
jgi:ribosomal protein S18 acetylase RimI-like enzyme